MTRLIDADAVISGVRNRCLGQADVVKVEHRIIDMLNRMPTVDAVPVVRCKDCKFSKPYYHGSESNLGMFTCLCTQGLYGMNADDFWHCDDSESYCDEIGIFGTDMNSYCSFAKRKEE